MQQRHVVIEADSIAPQVQIFDGKKPAPYMSQELLSEQVFGAKNTHQRNHSQKELAETEAAQFTLGGGPNHPMSLEKGK